MSHEVFFRPRPHWVGDVIPYADDEAIRLYYLYERRLSSKPGTPWQSMGPDSSWHRARARLRSPRASSKTASAAASAP